MQRPQPGRRAFITACLPVVCVLLAGAAPLYAQGRPTRRGGAVRVARDKLQEHDGAWRLLMRVRLPRPPEQPEVRLKFTFSQVAELQPGPDDDSHREIPVDPPRVIHREQVVDVRDLRGKIGVRARAELSLRRDGGFRPGIWLLDVQGPDGPVGDRERLKLLGVKREPDAGAPEAPDAGAEAGT